MKFLISVIDAPSNPGTPEEMVEIDQVVLYFSHV
jgi:hypothetical protein